MDKKLTDAEIVKALNTALGMEHISIYCANSKNEVQTIRVIDILDLINRLQDKNKAYKYYFDECLKDLKKANAENERLKSDVSVSRDAYMSMKDRYEYEKEKVEKAKQKCIDIGKALKNAKTEAYKECIEKVNNIINEIYNKHIFGSNDLLDEEKDAVINFSDDVTYALDNLLKEMAGENNA